MPTSDVKGSETATAQGVTLPEPAGRPQGPVPDGGAVDHWQRRLDRARATTHLRQQQA